MISDSDVVTGMRVRWDADTTLDALIPVARVYKDRIAEKTTWPAAAIKVTPGEIQRVGSIYYLRDFDAEIVAEIDAENAIEPGTLMAAITGAFGGKSTDYTAGLTISGVNVMHCLEKEGGGSPPLPFRRDSKDYLRVAAKFEIKVTGSE